MSNSALEILLVEDDSSTAMPIQQAISQLGHIVTYAATGQMALEISRRHKPQLAIVSTSLAGEPNGGELSKQLSENEIPILLLSAAIQDAKKLLHLKPLGGLIKPLREGEMEMILSVAQNMVSERLELKHRNQLISGIVDGLLDSVVIVNAARKIIFANATAARLTKRNDLVGCELDQFFIPTDSGNEELEATLSGAITGSSAIGSGSRATLRSADGSQSHVVVIVSSVRDASGVVTGASLSFRGAPANSASSDTVREASGDSQNMDNGDSPSSSTPSATDLEKTTPLRAKAIRSIELRLASGSTIQKHYVVVLLLSQFDMFRMRYGLNNAEKLVHAFSAHLIKSLPPEDRLYAWSNRTVVVLLERDSAIDEVRLEMTAFCSRRVDYYLNATGRSALVTLSASWNLIPLFDCPEAKKDPSKITEQIDAFERLHTKRK